jgi:hypothetical protein
VAGRLRVRGLVLAALVFAIWPTASALADGEAGVVIQEGSEVRTYCIAFEGDGIRGDRLLQAAGQTFDAYGGGSGLAVCSINDRGCQDAGSFSSCFCECQGNDCTYWAFFTREHGAGWVYSARAFNLLEAGDGDVHGWKWGQGGPNSAPAPQDITFEQICGHAPRGGAPPATVPPQPTAAVTSGPAGPPPLTVVATLAASPTSERASTPPLVTLTGTAGQPSPLPSPILPPAAGEDDDPGPGGSGLFAFGTIAALLVVAIAAALIWRRRRAI